MDASKPSSSLLHGGIWLRRICCCSSGRWCRRSWFRCRNWYGLCNGSSWFRYRCWCNYRNGCSEFRTRYRRRCELRILFRHLVFRRLLWCDWLVHFEHDTGESRHGTLQKCLMTVHCFLFLSENGLSGLSLQLLIGSGSGKGTLRSCSHPKTTSSIRRSTRMDRLHKDRPPASAHATETGEQSRRGHITGDNALRSAVPGIAGS